MRLEYTTIGDNVNRAQRHESNAPKGGILVSETTWEQLGEYTDTFARTINIEKVIKSLKGIGDVPAYAITLKDES
jgi:class 3 adenylate cyclase